MEIISMTCQKCGGILKVNRDADQITCQHCGTEYVISSNQDAISIKLLSEGLKKIQRSTEKTASELALKRLKEEKKAIMKSILNEIIKPLETFYKSRYHKLTYDRNQLDINDIITFLEVQLRKEQKAFFKNKDKMILFEKMLKISNDLLDKSNEIEKQEKYHHQVISKI